MNDEPKYTNNGTSGCVMRPAVSCKKGKTNDRNAVSKLFKAKAVAKDEVDMHNEIIDAIDPKGDFTLKLYENCDVDGNLFKRSEINKCRNFDENEKARKSIPQIVYEYGGYDLWEATRRFSFERIFLAMHRAFKGLVLMERNKYCHVDIKPDNMVFNNETGKISFIDFGLSMKFEDLYQPKNVYLFGYKYPFYPPEFHAIDAFYSNSLSKKSFDKNLKYLDALILNEGRAYFSKNAQFLREWEGIANPDMEEFAEFLRKEQPLPEKLASKYCNRLDVYMLGATILYLLYLCSRHGTSNVGKNSTFFIATLRLAKKMVYFTPSLRITPKKAFEEYRKIISMITTVPIPSLEPSPIKVRRVLSPKKPKVHSIKKTNENKAKAPCPEGKIRNPITGRCINIKQPKQPKQPKASIKPCPEGKVRNPATGRCINIKQPKASVTKAPCPEGKVRNPVTGRCINIKQPKQPKQPKASIVKAPCPEGKVRNPATGRCIKVRQ